MCFSVSHWAVAELAYAARMAAVAASLNTTADQANATGLGPLNPSSSNNWDSWVSNLGPDQIDDAMHGAYLVAGVSLRAAGYNPSSLDALALLHSATPGDRYAAAAALIAESQLGCVATLGGALLGALAAQPAVLAQAAAELPAAAMQQLRSSSESERLLAGSLATASSAMVLASERGLSAARAPVAPGSSGGSSGGSSTTGLGGVDIAPLKSVNQPAFLSDVLQAAAQQLLGARVSDAHGPTFSAVGSLIAGLVDLLENFKTAALSMAAGTSVVTAAVSGLAPYVNPLELLTMLAAVEQLYAAAADAVAAVGAGSGGLTSLDAFARDTLATRLSHVRPLLLFIIMC